MKHLAIFFALFALPLTIFSQNVKIGNIYYSINSNNTASVIAGTSKYEGVIDIPDTIVYENVSYPVVSIADKAFYQCSNVTSISLPNTITYIGHWCFSGSSISYIEIPSKIESISEGAFSNCKELEMVVLNENVKYIQHMSFYACRKLSSINLKNIKNIAWEGFELCSSLVLISFGENLNSIDQDAFNGCTSLSNVYCSSLYPPQVSSTAFTNLANITLHVPAESIESYSKTVPWCDFGNIVSITEEDDSQRCDAPVIFYSNGRLSLSCATQDAQFVTTINNTDIKIHLGNEISLNATYLISAYAMKNGYLNSETTTATLCWIDTTPTTEGISNDVAQIPANAVLIQADNGFINVSGIDDGQQITIYQTEGKQVAMAKAYNGSASVATNISKGTALIVKIGDKAVKVMMK